MSSRNRGLGPAFIKPRSKLRKWLPVLLLLGAAGCLTGAFLQFRLSQEVRRATVILVMDVSNSMDATDVPPSANRLAAAQEAARSFLAELPPDFRVGLVTFAEAAVNLVPPLSTRTDLQNSIGSLTTSPGESPGTVIGDGLKGALDSLEQDRQANGGGPAAVLLLTDGLDTGSQTTPDDAAAIAENRTVRVFTVLLGEPEADENGVLNTEVLERMATTTGGESFTAATAGALTGIYEDLGSTLSTRLAVKDIGLPFLIGAGVLGLLAAVALVKSMDTTDWR